MLHKANTFLNKPVLWIYFKVPVCGHIYIYIYMRRIVKEKVFLWWISLKIQLKLFENKPYSVFLGGIKYCEVRIQPN
jgi:hypothetical protein